VRRKALPALLLATACSLFTENGGAPPLLTTLPRSLTASESLLVSASNEFGFALFRQVRAAPADANVFLSPTSAAMALGMTLNGAAGLTLDSMRVALGLGIASLADINASYRSLIDLLRGLDPNSEFAIANSIWAQSGFPWKPTFLDAARTSFDAEVQSLDLQNPASLGVINDWVNQKTNGKIPTILDNIAQDEVMFLINAIYFKGAWRKAFDPDHTSPGTFQSVSGSQTVSMMSLGSDNDVRFAETAEAQVAELLYGNGAFAMTLVLPQPGGSLGDLAAGLDAAKWAQWVGGLHEVKIGLAMPKLRLEYKRELKDDLSALGMRRAFDPNLADFGAIAELGQIGNLFLTRVTQKTFVDVNEEGTQAAAVTSVGVGVTSAPAVFLVNRPFLFAIRERLTGTVLFFGQITRVP